MSEQDSTTCGFSDCCSFGEKPLANKSVPPASPAAVPIKRDKKGNIVDSAPLHPVLIEKVTHLSIFYGLFLVLFGSQFPTTILVFETFLLVGYDKTVEACKKIRENALATVITLKNLENETKGTVDKAMNAYHSKDYSDLSITDAKHLISVLSRVDYHHLTDALKTLQITVMVIMGCLNVKVVKAASLGSSVGNTISSTVHYYLDLVLKPFVPEKYWMIISPSITASTYSASLYLAVFSGTLIQTYQAALKGSGLISKGAFDMIFKKVAFLDRRIAKTLCDGIAVGLVFYALEFQTMNAIGANAGINAILTPVTMIENYLIQHNNV